MPAKPKEAQARFVFVGTVQKLRAANVAEVDDKERTVVVHVDRVEKGPESMAGYVGRAITVKLAPGEKVRAGEQVRFFTNGWLFAETLAVESLGHEAVVPAGAPRRKAAAARPGEARRGVLAASISTAEAASEPAARLKAAAIADRVASADVVVRGRVTAVRVASEERPAPRTSARRGVTAAATEAPRRKPITEHDPQWREAEIEVDEVEKGGTAKKKVVVRFPGSDDVRWYKAPKFQPGQEGVFILQKAAGEAAAPAARRKGAMAAATATAAGPDTFTALDPDDFQPSERAPEIRALAAATDEPE